MRGFGALEQVFSVFCSVYLSQAIAFLTVWEEKQIVSQKGGEKEKRKERKKGGSAEKKHFMRLYVSGKRRFLLFAGYF